MTQRTYLQSFVGDTISKLENIRDHGPVKEFSFDFDCKHLNTDINIANEVLEQYKLSLSEFVAFPISLFEWVHYYCYCICCLAQGSQPSFPTLHHFANADFTSADRLLQSGKVGQSKAW